MAEICVSSHHGSIMELLNDPEFRALAGREGFLIELRLDSYRDLNAATFSMALDKLGRNVVVTYRHPDEGGKRPGISDNDRLWYLQKAADRGVRYVDIEARTTRGYFKKGQSKLIISFHDFEKVPSFDALKAKLLSMAGDGDCDVIKIACMPETIFDTAPLLDLLLPGATGSGLMTTKPIIVLGMGEAGFWTRPAGPVFGSPFTYARAVNAPGTAPGQPSWLDLEDVYRFRELQPGWPVYGVIGNPIGHSLSPLLHNTALKHLRLPGVYLPFKVEGDVQRFLEIFERMDLRALAVTIPHKEEALDVCDEVHELAKSVGAVNTLIRRPDGTWWGTNTDAFAAADALEAVTGSLYGKNVLVMGAGGAAKAVAFGVKTRGAVVFVVNRTIEHAVTLASAVDGNLIKYEELDGKPNFAAVVNTTPLGMYPDMHRTPLEKDQIPDGSIVFDTVYNPKRTRLLQLAEEKGCKTLEGVAMFLRQGARQFELYTGAKMPMELCEQAVLNELERREARQS
ncbi:MAG TPA: shikimate dehydrogenase [Planctomycetota bacterium]|nr:shikimate dehydrogenase [Planctomycetota bacterium]